MYGMTYDNFPLGQIFDKGIPLKMGQARVRNSIDEMIPLIEAGKITLNDIITHRLPLVVSRVTPQCAHPRSC